ncbi:MAG: methylated-DNA--[protein]-cysteine S-methyltransferase [Methyloprofundus sp.]|nr:methylated-DNA--[protein]-cysteine S-methyltransferase [Methyloprofundus sp.]
MTLTHFNWQVPNQHDTRLSYCYNTPAGQLSLYLQGKVLCKTEWLTASSTPALPSLPEELQAQINACWLSLKAEITLPLSTQGTAFQHAVWSALRQIPIGQTRTYGELAKELNTSPRALANACRRNPFPLIIPCHRVLSKTGIGGYAGAITGKLIAIKTALLQYEKIISHEL